MRTATEPRISVKVEGLSIARVWVEISPEEFRYVKLNDRRAVVTVDRGECETCDNEGAGLPLHAGLTCPWCETNGRIVREHTLTLSKARAMQDEAAEGLLGCTTISPQYKGEADSLWLRYRIASAAVDALCGRDRG